VKNNLSPSAMIPDNQRLEEKIKIYDHLLMLEMRSNFLLRIALVFVTGAFMLIFTLNILSWIKV